MLNVETLYLNAATAADLQLYIDNILASGINIIRMKYNALKTQVLIFYYAYNTNYLPDRTTDGFIIAGNMIFTALIDITVEPVLFGIKLKGITTSYIPYINWGDGSVTFMKNDGTLEDLYHTNKRSGLYTVQIQNPASLIELNLGNTVLSGNANQLNNAVNLEKITLSNSGIKIGLVTGWSAKTKELYLLDANLGAGTNLLTGTITHMTDLIILRIFGRNEIAGDISGAVNLTTVFLGGNSTVDFDVTGHVNIEQLENTGIVTTVYAGHIFGDIAGCTNISFICADTELEGDISGCLQFRYLSNTNNRLTAKHLTGDISGLTRLYEIADMGATFTGSLTNLDKLQTYTGGSHAINKPTRFNNNPKLLDFTPLAAWVWTSAEINQLLADLWANRDADKTNEDAADKPNRHIRLNTAGSGSPTGQGIIDLAALRSYRSPGNNPIYNLWIIDVN